MNKVFIFNKEKLQSDKEYFFVAYLFLILVQVSTWFPISTLNYKYTILGTFFSLIFIYLTFMKKDFTLLDSLKCIWK